MVRVRVIGRCIGFLLAVAVCCVVCAVLCVLFIVGVLRSCCVLLCRVGLDVS